METNGPRVDVNPDWKKLYLQEQERRIRAEQKCERLKEMLRSCRETIGEYLAAVRRESA